jgi:predicted acyltransferase
VTSGANTPQAIASGVAPGAGVRARLTSVDAMRGLTVAAMLIVNDAGDWDHVHPWLEHSEWNGCTFADYIFPFFLFLVGVSITLTVDTQLARGGLRRDIARKVVLRGIRIVLLGLVLAAVSWVTISAGHAYRPMGVLQRIGICYTAGGLIALFVRDARMQWALIAAALLGYWVLLGAFGPLLPGANLADHIDSAILGKHAYLYDAASGQGRDPEGFLSTLPAIVTVLLGMRAGHWVRIERGWALPRMGLALMIAGALWALVFPINKQLWTSSFVLWTGGAGMLMLAIAHQGFDRWRWPPIGRSLGINAITAYAGAWVGICLLEGTGAMRPLYASVFVAVFGPPLSPWVPSLMFAVAFTAFFWVLIGWMTRSGWRITI